MKASSSDETSSPVDANELFTDIKEKVIMFFGSLDSYHQESKTYSYIPNSAEFNFVHVLGVGI